MAKRSVAVKEEAIEAPPPVKAPKTEVVKEKKTRSSKFPLDHVITLLVDHNPKRPGSKAFDKFERYEDEMTVEDFYKKGGVAYSLNWDIAHKNIKVAEEFDEDVEKRSKAEPKPKKPKIEKKSKEENEENEEPKGKRVKAKAKPVEKEEEEKDDK